MDDPYGGWSFAVFIRAELATEERARSGFFLAPLGIIVGVALFHGADLRLDWRAALGLALLLQAVRLAMRGRPLRQALLFTASFALVGQMLSTAELARTDTTIFSGEATVHVTGRVQWRDVDDRGRFRYLMDIEATDRPVLSRSPERVRILVSSRHEAIPIGGRYEGLVRLRPPSGPAFPGSYDFAYGPYFQGLGAYGYSLGAPDPAPAVDRADLTMAERIAAVRVRMAERIRNVLAGPNGAVASALITGERAGIPDDVDEWLRITGLAHVLSISGFHMVLIAGFTMVSVRTVASFIPGLPLLVSTKKIAAVAALLVATAYLLIAGDNVATQRSWIMLVIMLGAVLVDRPALTLRNVAISALIVMSLSPHAVLTASFQMSFAATAALVGAYGALMRRWNGRAGLPRPSERGIVAICLVTVAGLALSSLIAGGATMPYGAYHFQRATPFGGVVANLAAMPLFSFWIMPAGLLAVLAMPFGLDAPLLQIMGAGLSIVFEMARVLAEWFPDHATGLMTRQSLILLTAAVLSLCFFAGRARWLSVGFAAAGLWFAQPGGDRPELLVFEDGTEIALIDETGRIVHLKDKPNDFVDGQWQRAFPPRGEPAPASIDFACEEDVCRAVTRSGLSVAWTQDYEKTGLLCDSADIAIVARAIHLAQCRSGAHLVTLRTLRRTGSLAFHADGETNRMRVEASIDEAPREWNIHRHAAWPEYWRNPDNADPDAAVTQTTTTRETTRPATGTGQAIDAPPERREVVVEGSLSSGGSARPAGPAP